MGRNVRWFVRLLIVTGFALWFADHERLFRGASAPSASDSAAASSNPPATQSLPAIKNESAPSGPYADKDATTFIAIRYDKAHVVFRLGEGSEFSLEQNQEKTLHRLPDATSEYATLSTFAIDAELLEYQRNKFDAAHVGEKWQLELSEDSRIPVTISKPVALKWGCDYSSYAAAFLAEIAPEKQPAFAASKKDYVLIHKSTGAYSSKPGQVYIGPLPSWNPSPEVRSQVEKVIDEQLKDELAHEEARQAWMEPRKQFEELWGQGKVKLTYDAQAFQLSPDGDPLLFVRARWVVDRRLAVLMSLWIHLGPTVISELVEEDGARGIWLAANPGQSSIPPEAIAFDHLGNVVNVFARGDGYGELLLYFQGEESFRFTVFRYTPAGLAETKTSISDGC